MELPDKLLRQYPSVARRASARVGRKVRNNIQNPKPMYCPPIYEHK